MFAGYAGHSQKLQFGAEATPMLNYSYFEPGDTVYAGFIKKPYARFFTGGFYAKYNINDKWSILAGYHLMKSGYSTHIQYEYNYTTPLGAISNTPNYYRSYNKVDSYYFQIPVLLQYTKSIPGKIFKNNMKFFARAGTRLFIPNGGWNFRSRTFASYVGDSTSLLQEIRNNVQKGEWSYSALLSLGLEHQFKFGGAITLNVVYNQGFFTISNNYHTLYLKGNTYNFNIKTTDTYWGLSIGYFQNIFDFKKGFKRKKEEKNNHT